MNEKVKVTHIGNKYHARYIVDGDTVLEYACNEKNDISIMCRAMLRFANELGYVSDLTRTARRRANEDYGKNTGRIARVL
jgi:hypothetical protein